MKIAVMGAGGLGGYLGARLAYAGLDVTFIARGENLRALRETGLQVHSPKGDFTVDAVQTSDGSPPHAVGMGAAEVGICGSGSMLCQNLRRRQCHADHTADDRCGDCCPPSAKRH